LTGNELRRKYLAFFANKEHLVLPSASLVPEDDPTLLLIGAGMAPFKPFFTGKMKPPHPRISTSQKCVRTGDIENVGRTARHHTFFEMLGNFSFGDYFKREAIHWAWEFLTKVIQLPQEKLWITIHTEDDEAEAIWRDEVGIPQEKIIRLADNFWEIGPGPCGPCSEIHIDLGEERGCGKETCAVGCNCDRYLEIWNLVFTQFDRDEEGNYTPLAKKNIDTGAGLERIASVLQGKPSNFETDLLFPIIAYTKNIANVSYGSDKKIDVSLKVIGDHGRGMTVLIGDGVLPSNEGRGYVLRRIMRRAMRHGKLLGINKPFMTGIVDVVVDMFSEPYPELREKQDFIKKIVELEEKRFQETLDQGTQILQQFIEAARSKGDKVLGGEAVFKLYDTYGFPLELTQEILEEQGLDTDLAGFKAAMETQRERARAARAENERVALPDLSRVVTEETKYNPEITETAIVALIKGTDIVNELNDGEEGKVVLAATPFYAESGGQVGDSGKISTDTGSAEVVNVKRLPDGTIYHIVQVTGGVLRKGDRTVIGIDAGRRKDTARNHTATHLLHRALRLVLGEHVNQAGSLVEADRLRFDFSHFSAVTAEQIREVEETVNQAIFAGLPVDVIETGRDEAKEMGAIALFGEKYGTKVRVVKMGDYSIELCGGTHLRSTAEVGVFKIVSEGGVAAGVRRIEALTGHAALTYLNDRDVLLAETAAILKASATDVPGRVETLQQRIKGLEKEIAALQTQLAKGAVDDMLAKAREIAGAKTVIAAVQATEIEDLRNVADLVKDKLGSGIIVLGAAAGEKVNFVVMVTPDLVKTGFHAGNIVRDVAKIADGGGGGRPDMAQAGGKNPEKLQKALDKAAEIIASQKK
jgi:alanyl-tRNA synthetase